MNENEIIMENVDEVIELVPEKNGVDFGKVGIAILVVGAVAALGYKCYKLIKEKKATKGSQEADCVTAAEDYDFANDESAE